MTRNDETALLILPIDPVPSAYYRGADCIIMVYDVTNMESFSHVNDWLAEVNKFAPEDTCKLLVGNKCDKV